MPAFWRGSISCCVKLLKFYTFLLNEINPGLFPFFSSPKILQSLFHNDCPLHRIELEIHHPAIIK